MSAAPNEFDVIDAGSPSRVPGLRLVDAYPRSLSELPVRLDARIVALSTPDAAQDSEIVARLGELGFLPGERVRVVARGLFGDPIAVRVGTGTFALRKAEAACIQVRLEDESRTT